MELVEAELVPGLRVLGLKAHRIPVGAERGLGVAPRLLDARAGEERRQRERVERTRPVGRVGGGGEVSAVERHAHLADAPLGQPGRDHRHGGGECQRHGGGRGQRLCRRPRRASGGGEDSGGEEHRRRDCDEVPVVVHERVREPEGERDRQGRRGVPLPALEPPARADCSRRSRGHQRERRAQGRRAPCRRGTAAGRCAAASPVRARLAVALPRDLEAVRARADERIGR